MAVLEKIRVKMGIFIIVIIGIALLSFVIDANTFQSAVSLFSSKYDVGKINGNKISYQEFQKKMEYYNRIHQMRTGSSSLDDAGAQIVNESAWQDMMMENVFIPYVKSAGIDVGKEELFDLTQGSKISPVLMNEQSFLSADGSFNREMLFSFIRNIPQDNSGNLATYWDFLEKNMVSDQLLTKYVSLIRNSTYQTPNELLRSIDDNNITSDISFVMAPYPFDEDTSIAISRQEIRDYYAAHKQTFEQAASRDIEYVVFEVVPSPEDVDAARNDIERIYPEFEASNNLRAFLVRNSDVPLDAYYYKEGELVYKSAALDSFAFKATYTDILPIYQDENIFRAARINSIKQMPDSVFVEHILLDGRDLNAEQKADSLLNLLGTGSTISQLASANSLDQNPNMAPGEIGWMTQSYMIPGFDTCFTAMPGKPFKLQSNYGLHIINVRERTKLIKKVQLAILEKSAVAGKETFQSYYTKANELAAKADGKFNNFSAAVKEMGLPVVPSYSISESMRDIAGYPNSREITRWVYEAKKGDVSQIISVDNKYFFVVALTEVRNGGIPPVESLESAIMSTLRREKRNEKMISDIKTQIAGMTNIEEVAETLETTVSNESGMSFGSLGTQSFDAKFIGSVAGAPVNSLTGPVGGSIGVYIFNVNSRNTGAFYTEDDAKMRRTQLADYQVQMIQQIFEKSAGVVDNRMKFF